MAHYKEAMLIGVVLFFFWGTAHSGLTLEQYRASRGSSESKEHVDSYIHGFGRGIWWGTGLQRYSRFFCLPKSQRLDKELTLSLVEQEIRDPTIPEGEWQNEALIEYILIKSLTNRFPCHNKAEK